MVRQGIPGWPQAPVTDHDAVITGNVIVQLAGFRVVTVLDEFQGAGIRLENRTFRFIVQTVLIDGFNNRRDEDDTAGEAQCECGESEETDKSGNSHFSIPEKDNGKTKIFSYYSRYR